MNIRAVMLLLVSFAGPGLTRAQVPGWLIAGNSPQDYTFTLDSTNPPNGRSALIASKPEVELRGFGTLMQEISAENYRGQHVRLSGYLRTEAATRAHAPAPEVTNYGAIEGVTRSYLLQVQAPAYARPGMSEGRE